MAGWSRWPWFYNKSPNEPVIPPVVNPPTPNADGSQPVIIIGPDTSHTPQPEPPANQQYGNTANLFPHQPSRIPQSISEPSEVPGLLPPVASNMWAIVLIVVVVLLVVLILIGAEYWGN